MLNLAQLAMLLDEIKEAVEDDERHRAVDKLAEAQCMLEEAQQEEDNDTDTTSLRKWLVEGSSYFATGFLETVEAQTEEEAEEIVRDRLTDLYITVGGYSGVDLQEIDVQSCTVQED